MKSREKEIIIASMFILIITVLLLHFFSPANVPMFNKEPYLHAKSSSIIIANNFEFTEKISYHGGTYTLAPYDYVLAFFGNLIGIESASNILPLISGIFTLFLFYLLMERFNPDKNLRITASLLLLISPALIYNSLISQPYTIIVPLLLATFYFITRKDKLKFASIPFAAFAAYLDPLLIIIMLIPLALQLKKVTSRNLYLTTFVISMAALLARFYTLPFFNTLLSPEEGFLINNINFFGSIIGFSLFAIILAFTGLLNTWPKKRQYFPLYVSILLLVLSSIYLPGHKIILNLILTFLAAKGLIVLLRMKWELRTLRELSIIIIIVGLIFSPVLYFNTLSNSSPDPALVNTLRFLKGNSYEHEVVLSHNKNNHWIEYISGRKAYSPDNKTIYKTRDEQKALALLEKNKISYVLVDKSTRGLMKTKENNIGLEFVMENSDKFKRLRTQDNIVLWAKTA